MTKTETIKELKAYIRGTLVGHDAGNIQTLIAVGRISATAYTAQLLAVSGTRDVLTQALEALKRLEPELREGPAIDLVQTRHSIKVVEEWLERKGAVTNAEV